MGVVKLPDDAGGADGGVGEAVEQLQAWPRASLPLSANIHLNVLNNSYERMYIKKFEHVHWRIMGT